MTDTISYPENTRFTYALYPKRLIQLQLSLVQLYLVHIQHKTQYTPLQHTNTIQRIHTVQGITLTIFIIT
jgi:hypothetical protein